LVTTTLLNLITALQEYTANDTEVVAVVAFLINTDRVRLCGSFAGARIDLSPAASASAPSVPLPPGRAKVPRQAIVAPAVGTRQCGHAAESSGSHWSPRHNLLRKQRREGTRLVPQ